MRRAPEEIRVGNATVTIYWTQNRGKDFASLSYYWAGERRQKLLRVADRHDEKRIRSTAREIAAAVWNGRAEQVTDMNINARVMKHARDALAGLGLEIDAACREYAKARSIVGDSGTLLDAAEFYRRSKPAAVAPKLLREVVTEFVAAQKSDGISKRYGDELSRGLRRLVRDLGHRYIADVTAAELRAWLRTLKREDGGPLSARTRNNLRGMIVTLFRAAQQEGYLRKEVKTEAEWLKKLPARTTIHIFPLKEFRTLLYGAVAHDPRCVHYLSLGTFAFLRPNEMLRMSDRSVRFPHNDIEVTEAEAKGTRRKHNRRLIPMQPNLRAWLEAFPLPRGKFASKKTTERVRALCKKLGITWHHDIMRHTGISMAVALTGNVDQVALWAGNSRQVIYASYLNQVTPAEAAEFYGLMPPSAAQKITRIA